MSTTTTPSYPVHRTPFPARTRTATSTINNTPTTATSITFADKILLTLTQAGRLAHWIHVPLATPLPDPSLAPSAARHDPDDRDNDDDDDDSDAPAPPAAALLLPLPHLAATTLLGGTRPHADVVGQLLATQVAGAIAARAPLERRTVVVGLGLEGGAGAAAAPEGGVDRGVYMDLLELALRVV